MTLEYRPEFFSDLFSGAFEDSALSQSMPVRDSVVQDEKANEMDSRRRLLSKRLSRWSRSALARERIRVGDVSFLRAAYDFEVGADPSQYLAQSPDVSQALALVEPETLRPMIRFLSDTLVIACRTQNQVTILEETLDKACLGRIAIKLEPQQVEPKDSLAKKLELLYGELASALADKDALDSGSEANSRMTAVEQEIEKLEAFEANIAVEKMAQRLSQPLDVLDTAKAEMAALAANYEGSSTEDPSGDDPS